MKRKSNNYSTPDGGGWMNKSDDLFLAQFRKRPCAICGARGGFSPDSGKTVSSCGHHLIFKGRCRQHRYEPKNIIVLCPQHHSHYNKHCSPHSIVSTHAQTVFEEWVRDNKPEQYAWWMEHQPDADKIFDKSWTYRDVYASLGGEIAGEDGPMKDWKPKLHKKKVDALVELNKAK